ncbi:MAG: M20/M25/M40 family metallo-hydrolase [bacterium]
MSGQVMREAGIRYLADLGVNCLVEGDELAVARLKDAGAAFVPVAVLRPGEDVYLLKPRTLAGEITYAGGLFEVGRGQYVTTIAKHDIEQLRDLPFTKVRLLPTIFPERSQGMMRLASGAAITPKPEIEDIVAAVSSDTVSKYISQMSGREPVVIGGTLDTLLTRYSYSTSFPDAAAYVYERFQGYGIPVEYQTYTVSVFDFYADYFVNDSMGWAVGSDQKVFKTTDAGATWVRQSPGAANQIFHGASFVDSLTGWLTGTAGTIRKTTNGGTTWTTQASGASSTLREVVALDSQNAWVVGYGGTVRRTVNGGTNWTTVASGVSVDLYGCHFRSNSRGWASGAGVMIFWNGTSWSSQTVGTGENLIDVYFVDDNVGWTVGNGATILKTVDGGQNWTPQTAPADADPSFRSVCFVDSLEGWAVGLSGTIIHTTNSGATWEVQDAGSLFGLRWVDFVDSETGCAVGYGGTILRTDDGGATWVNQRGNLPSANVKFLDNVVATKPGTVSTDYVVICGHLDSTSPDPYNRAPGADDNASGTAAAIEAARVMASTPFRKTIKFCAWSGEEQGLYGSGEYAGQASSDGDVIAGVLNFDMIGYVNVAPEDIDVIGNASSEWLVDLTIDCADAYVPGLATLKMIDPTVSGSDHYMFWQAGYDALLAIEDENVPYPYYHTVNDTLGNITMSFCTDVVRMGIATAAELAELDTVASVPAVPAPPFAVSASPNPLVAGTRIAFALSSQSEITARVYDVRGREVRTLFSGSLPAGAHQVVWQGDAANGAPVSPGVYFATVATEAGERSTKIMVLR